MQPQALTRQNGEEADFGYPYATNFTKGLYHNQFGLVDFETDYPNFVKAINSDDPNLFEEHVETAKTRAVELSIKPFRSQLIGPNGDISDPEWRGWESPRSGHVYELQGLDSGAVGMAPSPRVGSSEAAVEMAEVYTLALMRDVPFTALTSTGSPAEDHIEAIAEMPFFAGTSANSHEDLTPISSTLSSGLDRFERNRRDARLLGESGKLTPETAFRGSTPGAFRGPYISQFMLIGSPGRDAATATGEKVEALEVTDGQISYGTLTIDQKTFSHTAGLDYLTNWDGWLDAQNGADFRGMDTFETGRRFITTPRDLATYVHYDALYEAYLNAALLLLQRGAPTSRGFPEPSLCGKRSPFATFGGPHILSLVCEVATRCLKAVRRQKFNYHRRCRPEAIGGRLTLLESNKASELGLVRDAFTSLSREIPDTILNAIDAHNATQNTMDRLGLSTQENSTSVNILRNLLLPMAFPEGSPMHPAYGAGHATVAGGCVTMLKAFFDMYCDNDSGKERPLYGSGSKTAYVPNNDGDKLTQDTSNEEVLTIQGELDKLAANISIGRNMAGVHYYSDYYDSLRMGERIAVGILMEQAPTYGDTVETKFTSFDGDLITFQGTADSRASLSVLDRDGNPISSREWWLRHVLGQELSEDLSK